MDVVSEYPVYIWEDDGNGEEVEVSAPDRSVVIVPDCCKEAQCGTIYLGWSYADKCDQSFDYTTTPPKWQILLNTKIAGIYSTAKQPPLPDPIPSRCSFCGSDLPKIQKRVMLPDGPVYTDDDTHCGTCNERGGWGCMCWSPVVRWEPVP